MMTTFAVILDLTRNVYDRAEGGLDLRASPGPRPPRLARASTSAPRQSLDLRGSARHVSSNRRTLSDHRILPHGRTSSNYRTFERTRSSSSDPPVVGERLGVLESSNILQHRDL
jgi:hypothetical protein